MLFADVVRSMDIAAAVGAERLREIMARLFDRCAAVVRRFGGTVDKFTGDGIMAVFGAPVALEDHAFRACLAALEIQRETAGADDVVLRLRVGLNSGEVVAGQIGSGPGSYTTVGEQVGMAQRMESVAPAGGVMLSASTARLVADVAVLGEPESVPIKGAVEPVLVRRLLAVSSDHRGAGRQDPSLVGRAWELAALAGMLDAAVGGGGCVVSVVGPPGIGKSRVVREVTALAQQRGAEVFTSYCESHACEIPFHAVTSLLRTVLGVGGVDDAVARARVRERISDADPQDLLLLDDLLGIRDGGVELPAIEPDARRRRLTRLANTVSLARTTPALFVIEDVHWIDEASESLLVDFLTVIPQTPALVVLTCRPEYHGALTRASNSQTITLAPLNGSQVSMLTGELLGADASVAELVGQVTERAAGNPFFVQEIVRDLAERGVLRGKRGGYLLCGSADEVKVPASLQATIAARIDRLDSAAKLTLSAASVIGSRFSRDLLVDLDITPMFDELTAAELVDQVRFTPYAEYVFHHPLIRTVAYESQLKSDRAVLHRRLAAVIEAHDPAAADANAALIAEHLEAAGDLLTAYAWHMRAGVWSADRNIAAAQVSWERASQIADVLPAGDPNQLAMRIAPRTLICGNGLRSPATAVGARFDELRDLCSAAGDKASVAVGMTGLIGEHMFHGRVRAASRVASEQMALVESIGDPTLTVGLSFAPIVVKTETGELDEMLRWSEAVVDLADGDPTKGNFNIGSPLALALALRGTGRWALGRAGWREDFGHAIAMARSVDPLSYAICICWAYGIAIAGGVLLPDPDVQRDIDEALRVAERSADDITLGFVMWAMIAALIYQDPPDDQRATELLKQLRDMCAQGRFYSSELRNVDMWLAHVVGRRGDRDRAIPQARDALDAVFNSGQLVYFVSGTWILAELLLDRGDPDCLAEVQAVIDRLAAAPLTDDYVFRDLTLLRLRALLARARDDEVGYRDFAAHYRRMATDLGFEGHIVRAEAMT